MTTVPLSQKLRAGLHVEYLAGQQGFVNDMTRALDTLDKAMEAYAGHSAPGGSGTTGTLVPAGGNELALRLQESIAEGLSAASVPAVQGKEAGVLSAFRDTQAPSGIAKAGLVDDATADQLLRNQSMVDFLTRKGALKLTKAMPQEQKRAAIRQAVEKIVGVKKDSTVLTEKGPGDIVGTKVQIDYIPDKMDNYLLKLDHPKGGSKAKFLHDVLGYQAGDGRLLYDNIRQAIEGLEPFAVKDTPYGLRHLYEIRIPARKEKGLSAKVVVVLQKDIGKTTWRIITLYPGKKDEE